MAAAAFLAVMAQPTLGQGIPTSVMPAGGQRVAGMIAAYLASGKAVTPAHFPMAANDPLDACAVALSSWLHRRIGETRCLEPVFLLEPVPVATVDDLATVSSELGASDAQAVRGVHISWYERNVCHWTVGQGLERLQDAVPGLGATVLCVMEDRSAHACPLFSPSVVLDEASNQYWLGESDETEFLDGECGDDEQAREAMRADMVTRADIESAFPQWALHRPRRLLPRKALRDIAITHADAYVRQAAALAHSLASIVFRSDFAAGRDGQFTGYSAVLCWRVEDIAVRVSDDYAHWAWQGESFDEIGEVILPIDDPATLQRWMRAVTPHLRAIGLVDRLLSHLSEGY